ncbi:glycosyltransferase 61 family protein [Roseobacter sp. AzwK-3b]|uniref:glycosyltransferase 61 family protein n=1 Tax=Roseobacter sp. AzwK-3b TaxID=351016 RepID=UPI0018DE35D4|nr:glycosyltransferase 61 family protein [Roseobacter sp. AzwK-3b]
MPAQDWRRPGIRLKNRLTRPIRKAMEITGRSKDYAACETVKTTGATVSFIGDVPSVAGLQNSQNALSYAQPRPMVETLDKILYTPSGNAWHNGCLLRKASSRRPSIREILDRPKVNQAHIVEQAYIIESETPYTYGDWVGDHIRALVEAPLDIRHVVLPLDLAQKSYVQRDVGRLGFTLVPADKPLMILKAHVLRKQLPSYYWGKAQVNAYRDRFQVRLIEPQPGSLIYLSREGIKSEAVDRVYPSAQIAGIVRRLGGEVFDTRYASPEAFARIALRAETVIADQGSAIFGVLQWQTKNLIEITTENWWHNANLFFAHASGIENYAVLVSDRYQGAALENRLMELLSDVGFYFPDIKED